MEEQISEEIKVLIESLSKKCTHPIDVHNLFDVSVINVLWAMMAGQRFELEDLRSKKLLSIIHDAFRSTDISGGLLNQMPFLRFIMPERSGYNQHVNLLKRMWSFLQGTPNDSMFFYRKTYTFNRYFSTVRKENRVLLYKV